MLDDSRYQKAAATMGRHDLNESDLMSLSETTDSRVLRLVVAHAKAKSLRILESVCRHASEDLALDILMGAAATTAPPILLWKAFARTPHVAVASFILENVKTLESAPDDLLEAMADSSFLPVIKFLAGHGRMSFELACRLLETTEDGEVLLAMANNAATPSKVLSTLYSLGGPDVKDALLRRDDFELEFIDL